MKAVLIMIVLLAFSLAASANPIAVGGDFGRAWISNYLAENPSPVSQDNNSSSGNWGNTPKVQGTIGSNIVSQQNATNLIKPSSNWLGDSTNLGNPSSPQNFTQVPFFIGGGLKPVHAMEQAGITQHKYPSPIPMDSYMDGMRNVRRYWASTRLFLTTFENMIDANKIRGKYM